MLVYFVMLLIIAELHMYILVVILIRPWIRFLPLTIIENVQMFCQVIRNTYINENSCNQLTA